MSVRWVQIRWNEFGLVLSCTVEASCWVNRRQTPPSERVTVWVWAPGVWHKQNKAWLYPALIGNCGKSPTAGEQLSSVLRHESLLWHPKSPDMWVLGVITDSRKHKCLLSSLIRIVSTLNWKSGKHQLSKPLRSGSVCLHPVDTNPQNPQMDLWTRGGNFPVKTEMHFNEWNCHQILKV